MTYYKFGKFTDEWAGTPNDNVTWVIDGGYLLDDWLVMRLPSSGCEFIDNWPDSAVVATRYKNRREDMPEAFSNRPIVSDRLRRLIENLDPNAAQYLPVEIHYRGIPIDGQYWVANWLQEVDCVDWDRSVPKGKPPKGEHVVFWNTVLDQSKIPSSFHVFLPTQAVCKAICSESLKNAIENSGITGCGFLPLDSRVE
ncbi:MAG: DUF1629 domain-containing protein [Planctomycetes bacterium]|nr:DUF1629 domain-containing protein [Planctomycetota bacterium]